MIPFSQSKKDLIKQAMVTVSNGIVVETSDWDLSYVSDGVHPSAVGAKKAGHLLAEALKKSCPDLFS